MFAFLTALPFVGTIVKFLELIIATLKAIIPPIAEIIVDFLKLLWEGCKDVLDNGKTIVFVLVLCGAVWLYANVDGKNMFSCKDEIGMAINDLRKDYVFIKRKDAEKKKLKDAFVNH